MFAPIPRPHVPPQGERDPITCPKCQNVAQWRGTVYRCKEGHETRRPRK